MLRIMAYIHDMDLLRDLMELTRNETWIHMMALSTLPSGSDFIRPLSIDVLLLDCTKDQEAAIAFAATIRAERRMPIRIVYMLENRMTNTVQKIIAQDAKATIMYAPFSVSKMMMELMKNGVQKQGSLLYLNDEGTVSQLIQDMGIPVHLNGFRYIKTAVIFLLQRNDQKLLMHQLYKEIARIHMTTSSRVEKAIRDAIDYAYRFVPEQIQIQHRKPTNSQLIHLVYERMLQKQQETHEERKVLV